MKKRPGKDLIEDGHWARFLGFHMKTKKQEGPGRIFDHRCSYLLLSSELQFRKKKGTPVTASDG